MNTMNLAFAAKLNISTLPISISAKKINRFTFKTFDMVIARFLIQDKSNKIRFFEEIFLLADTILNIVLRMLFLAFSNADIELNIESFS